MVDFILRPATEVDSPAIRDLIKAGRINPMDLDWRRFIVAVILEGKVIGCGQIKRHANYIYELASIAVSPHYHFQGVAQAIINALISKSPRPLYLICRSRLRSFYEKFGFSTIIASEMPPYFMRISKIVGLIEALSKKNESLLVMRLNSYITRKS